MAAKQVSLVNYLCLAEGPSGLPHLRAWRCANCEAQYLDLRPACGRCAGRSFEQVPVSNTGTVRTFTIVERAAPGVPTPFVCVVVDTDNGPSVRANLLDVPCEPERIPRGMRVGLTTFVVGRDGEGTEAVGFGYAPLSPEIGGSA